MRIWIGAWSIENSFFANVVKHQRYFGLQNMDDSASNVTHYSKSTEHDWTIKIWNSNDSCAQNQRFWIQKFTKCINLTRKIRMINLIKTCWDRVRCYREEEKNEQQLKIYPWIVGSCNEKKNARCIKNALQRVKVRINKNALPYDDGVLTLKSQSIVLYLKFVFLSSSYFSTWHLVHTFIHRKRQRAHAFNHESDEYNSCATYE